jgi:hypothetical protein
MRDIHVMILPKIISRGVKQQSITHSLFKSLFKFRDRTNRLYYIKDVQISFTVVENYIFF